MGASSVGHGTEVKKVKEGAKKEARQEEDRR